MCQEFSGQKQQLYLILLYALPAFFRKSLTHVEPLQYAFKVPRIYQ